MSAHTPQIPEPEAVTLPSGRGGRAPIAALAMGVVALGLLVVTGGGGDGDHGGSAIYSYLVAYLFGLTIALGGLFFVLLHHAVRAGWSTVVRRLAEHVAATLPLFALLFIPIAMNLPELFPWARPEAADDPLLVAKSGYLNPQFFYIRAAIYLVCWSALGWYYRSRSLAQDASGDPAITRRLQSFAPPAIILFGVTTTLASFDWVMSLDPHWYSTIFGVYFFAGSVVAILSTLILMALRLGRRNSLAGTVTWEHFHDLGKLLFAFVVFWAYIGFSQFMLIWYGNIPEETLWYAHRTEPGWKGLTIALAVGHFAVPFLFLLSRGVKRRSWSLALGALWMLAMHALDLYWLVMPAFHPHGADFQPADLLALGGISGVFVGTLAWLLRRQALIPVRDPRLPESLSFENV